MLPQERKHEKANVNQKSTLASCKKKILLYNTSMHLNEFDDYIKELLKLESVSSADPAFNGLQVTRTNSELKKIAFSVDASLESFKRALQWGADLLFVHHGLFFGEIRGIKGNLYKRLKFLIDNNLALYAVHLPLDMHPQLGNNAGIARLLELKDLEPFGIYHDIKIGFKGSFNKAKTLPEINSILLGQCIENQNYLSFGKEKVRTVGIISGGASQNAREAIEQGLDLFITGESSHDIYHECQEEKINVIFVGHYLSEVWGIKSLKQNIEKELNLETAFIDIPTGY